MDKEKFHSIVHFNKDHKKEITEAVKIISERINISSRERRVFDALFFNNLAKQHMVFSFFIPIKSNELGACCYDSSNLKYIVVNSSLPKVNMNFAYAHELYHALIAKNNSENSFIEVYTETDDANNTVELMANAFAGAFLATEAEIAKVWSLIESKISPFDKCVQMAAYFAMPYVAMLIRLVVLGYIDEDIAIPDATYNDVLDSYEKAGLDVLLLKPTMTDNYKKIVYILDEVANGLVKIDLLSCEEKEAYINNMQLWYQKITRSGDDTKV